jgi:hypothetical protein
VIGYAKTRGQHDHRTKLKSVKKIVFMQLHVENCDFIAKKIPMSYKKSFLDASMDRYDEYSLMKKDAKKIPISS